MFKKSFIALVLSLFGFLDAKEQFSTPIDSRMKSIEWKVRFISKHEPTGDEGCEYRIYERKGELVIVYSKKNKLLKITSLCGENVKEIPSSKVTINGNVLKYGSNSLCLIDSGQTGRGLY